MENRSPSAPTPPPSSGEPSASRPAPAPTGLPASFPPPPDLGWPAQEMPDASSEPETPDNFAQTVHDQVAPPAQPKVYIASKRKAILDESMDKVTQTSAHPTERLSHDPVSPPTTTYISLNSSRAGQNKKRNPHIGKLIFLLLIMNLLVTAAAGAWIYNKLITDIENRMADLASMNNSSSNAHNSGAAHSPAAPAVPPPAEDLAALGARLENRLADVQAQLLATQKRLSDAELLNKQQAQSLRDVNDAVAMRPATAAAGTSTLPTPGMAIPSQSELVLLKERNRLSGYADEAIATGARAPYDRLWEALDDPRLAGLVHAARAEILRVQNFYLSGSRLDAYDIPVASYFPDSAALKDTQLKEDELVTLLANSKHPWQVRMKAANLLGLRRSKSSGDALVKAILEDQNLDVVKEASFSFEQMTGFRARLFEPAAVKAWWDQYNATATGTPPAPNAAKQRQ